MTKDSLLRTIAQRGYNMGFGAKKHFISYNIFCNAPRALSLLIIFIGVFQLLNIYRTSLSVNVQDIISAVLICAGVVALIIDADGKNKREYDSVGKKLTMYFNELQAMYNEVKVLEETADLSRYRERLGEIERDFHSIAISAQVPFTHIYTNFLFFFGGTQIDWIHEQLNFKLKDKFPFYHSESLCLYIITLILLVYLIHRFAH